MDLAQPRPLSTGAANLPVALHGHGLEVIGAGWGRTATKSLKVALDTLGLPCYHMIECFKHKGHEELWQKAYEGQPVDFREMLKDYKAAVDWPAATFYKQLMEVFPETKVILTVRDPAKWYTSAQNSIWAIAEIMHGAPWYVRPFQSRGLKRNLKMVDKIIWNGDLQGSFGRDPQRAQQLFKQHVEEVKTVVPADRLLVFEPSQGWGPLCAFLDKPVPKQPFPHVNDTQEWQKWLAAAKKKNTSLAIGVPAVIAATVAVVARLIARQ